MLTFLNFNWDTKRSNVTRQHAKRKLSVALTSVQLKMCWIGAHPILWLLRSAVTRSFHWKIRNNILKIILSCLGSMCSAWTVRNINLNSCVPINECLLTKNVYLVWFTSAQVFYRVLEFSAKVRDIFLGTRYIIQYIIDAILFRFFWHL